MRYREGGSLDTSGVQDRRGRGGGMGGGRGLAVGGGGLGLSGWSSSCSSSCSAVVVATSAPHSAASGASARASRRTTASSNRPATTAGTRTTRSTAPSSPTSSPSRTSGRRRSATSTSPTDTVFFSGQVQTSCGGATSGSGPFYCPADQLVYIDLSFFDQLQSAVRRPGRPVRQAYVLAHEYGHHVQNLLGTNQQATPGRAGPTSGTVRLELQADCYAGAWANHAETVPDDPAGR